MLKKLVHQVLSLTRVPASDGFRVVNSLALAADQYSFRRSRKVRGKAASVEINDVLNKVKKSGFAAIENFVSSERCAFLKEKLSQNLQSNAHLLHPGTRYDLRLHGVENVDQEFLFFAQHPFLVELAQTYLQRHARSAFTLGASLQAIEGNPGSGGGWHRDSMLPQFKTMLYLTDVGSENGAFQILEGSHHFMQTVLDNRIAKSPYGQVRFTEKQVQKILDRTKQSRLHTLAYPAGTLLIFDSSTIHRGSPIRQGTRYALTNYFYPSSDIGPDLYQHFAPVAGHCNA